jgi:hypothetical protein
MPGTYMKERNPHLVLNHHKPVRGSMLLLTCAIGVVLVILIVFAVTLGQMFVHHVHEQSITDASTLRAAAMLNANDQIGRMNNLVVQSRELVFDSRAAQSSTMTRDYWYLAPLAQRLLDDSRWGASFVDQARQRLIVERLKSLLIMASSDASLQSHGIKVTGIQVGNLADSRSNVYDDEANELQEFDDSKHWIDPKTRLFVGNINAELPNEDKDLIFKISPLYPPIKGKMVQAAIINNNDFKPTATIIENGKPTETTCEHMPSAVKIDYAVEEKAGKDYGPINFRFSSSATTNGGQLAP